MLIALIRLIAFTVLSLVYVVSLTLTSLLKYVDSGNAKRVGIFLTKRFCKLILILFNIKVKANLKPTRKGSLYVCNHLSYLDAIALFAHVEAVFITSTEIRDTPGLGTLCKLANCLFTNRQNFWGIKNEIRTISKTMEAGFNVVLFPEGTTSSGHFMKNFKSSLVQAAVDSDTEIVPIAINYRKFNGRVPQLEDRDYYAWYGSMEFMPHIIRLATIESLELTVDQLPSLEIETGVGARKVVTKKSQKMIDESYEPVIITC